MGDDVEIISKNFGLKEIAQKYKEIEKEFGELTWDAIGGYFPEDFDIKVMMLNDIIANIGLNSDNGDGGVHLIRIDKEKYNGVMADLYEQIKGLNGMNLDNFYIEVDGYNFKNDRNNFHKDDTSLHQINIRIKMKSKKVILDADIIGVEKSIKDNTSKLLK